MLKKIKKFNNNWKKEVCFKWFINFTENIVVHLVDINENLFENVVKLAKDNNYLLIDKLMGFITGF